MQRLKPDMRHLVRAGLGRAAILAVCLVLIPSMSVHAQSRPPLQEPLALEGTTKRFYKAANVVLVTMTDGVEHVYHFIKDLIVYGGKKPGVDALEGLREGTMIAIHRTTSGPEASVAEIDLVGDERLKITEGAVININRRKQEITIEYADETTETFKMTPRAVPENETGLEHSDSTVAHIVVYYSDEPGRKVAHYVRAGS